MKRGAMVAGVILCMSGIVLPSPVAARPGDQCHGQWQLFQVDYVHSADANQDFNLCRNTHNGRVRDNLVDLTP